MNPGVGKDAMGNKAPALDIEKITQACGVKHIYTSGPDDLDSTLKDTFRKALSHDELTLVIVRMNEQSRLIDWTEADQ